jgi:hypothetical protein
MKRSDDFEFRAELWAEGQLYCYTNIRCPKGLGHDEAFDYALAKTLENGGSGFEIRILQVKTGQSALRL